MPYLRCQRCGEEFFGKPSANAKYCGRECRDEACRKPTDARDCHCGETVFATTSGWCVAIVDADDGHFLRNFKWSATSRALNYASYARSWRYRLKIGKSQYLHQAVSGHVHEQLDHRNGSGHDCRKDNLRPCTNSQNQRNVVKRIHVIEGLQSKHKAVSWDRNTRKWKVEISVDGHRMCFGFFAFEADAAICANYHMAHYHGEFAKRNKITEDMMMHD